MGRISHKSDYGKAAFVLPFLLAMASTPIQAKGPERIEFEPSSPWHVDWLENTCILQRVFGTGDDYIGLRMEKFGPESGFQISLTGQRLRAIRPSQRVTIHYGESGYSNTTYHALVSPVVEGIRTVFFPVGSRLARKSKAKRPPRDPQPWSLR